LNRRPFGDKIEPKETAANEETRMDEVTYVCSVCHKQATVKKGDPIPMCCRREMEPLPFCTSVPQAEMVRDGAGDQPCDDGTLPRKKK
jgi:hypothetical protein